MKTKEQIYIETLENFITGYFGDDTLLNHLKEQAEYQYQIN